MTSVIIPLYFNDLGNYQIYDRCFESFKKYNKDFELIVVDDCSPYDTSDWPVTHKNEVNLGFSGNVNTGLKLASGDKLWVVNDDVEFNPEIMEKMDTIEDGAIYLPCWGGDSMEDDKIGFFWGLTKNTLSELGYLDEDMKHYFSDLDMWKRAKQKGIKIIKWPIVVSHYSGATYKGNTELYNKDAQAYIKKWGQLD